MSNTITIDIVAETKKLVDGVDNATGKLGKMEEGMGKAAKAAVGLASAFILDKGVDFLKGAVEEAQAAEKALAAANVVFGKTPGLLDNIASQADNFGRALGVDNDVLLELGTTLGTYLPENLKGLSLELVNTGYDVAALTKTDPATWTAKMGKAMADGALKIGEMTKLFPGLSEATYAQAEAMSKAGDNQGALNLLMGEANKAYGDAAESQVTASQKMTVAVDALKEKIGTALLPVIEKAVGWLTQMVDWVTQNSDVVMPLATVVGGLAASILLVNVAMGAWTAITTAWSTVTKIATAVQAAFNLVMSLNPIMLVVLAIVALIAIIVLLVKNWDTVTEVVGKVWEAIKEWGSKVWDWMQTVWEAIQKIFKAALEAVWKAITWYFETYINIVKTVFEAIKNFLSTAWDFIKNLFSTVLDAIKTIVTNVFNAYKSIIETVWNAVKSFFETVWNAIKTAFETVLNAIKTYVTTVFNAYKTIIETVWNAVKGIFETVWNGIKSTFTTTLDTIKSTVSTVFNTIKDTIRTIFTNVWDFIQDIWGKIKSIVTGAVDTIKNAVSNGFNALKSSAESIFNAFKSTVSTIWDGIKGIIETVVNNVVSKIGELPAKALEIGKAMVTGIWNGLQSMGGWLSSQISGWVGNMINAAKSALGINSPSKEFAKLGAGIVEGLVLGIDRNADDANASVKALSNLTGDFNVPTLNAGSGYAPAVNITINAGVGTDPYELGRTVTKAVNKYSNISRAVR